MPLVAPVIKATGFGFKGLGQMSDGEEVDSILEEVSEFGC